MIPLFRDPEIRDYDTVHKMFGNTGLMSCDYNFASIYLWREFYEQKIGFLKKMFFSKVKGRMGEAFLCPAGNGSIKEAVESLKKFCEAEGIQFVLVCVTDEQKEQLEIFFPDRFVYEDDRDAWDYVYSVQKLAELPGRNLHGKRNHIKRFITNNPDWNFEILKKKDVVKCEDLLKSWTSEKLKDGFTEKNLRGEPLFASQALDLVDDLNLVCGAIIAGGKVVAFSVGSLTNPYCFNIHIEKAVSSMAGSYQIINREMARYVQRAYPRVKWINREDDMGLEGLRKSKESYLPDLMIRKYVALYSGNES